MTSYVFGISAAILAVSLEVIFRKYGAGGYLRLMPYAIPVAILINYSIFRLAISVNNLLEITIIFSFCTLTLRLLGSKLILKEELSTSMIVAFFLVVLAQIVKALGGT